MTDLHPIPQNEHRTTAPVEAAAKADHLERWSTADSSEELAQRIAHDLIQPLSDIVNRVWLCHEAIRDLPNYAELREPLSSIEEQAMHTAQMIRDARRFIVARLQIDADRIGPNDTIS